MGLEVDVACQLLVDGRGCKGEAIGLGPFEHHAAHCEGRARRAVVDDAHHQGGLAADEKVAEGDDGRVEVEWVPGSVVEADYGGRAGVGRDDGLGVAGGADHIPHQDVVELAGGGRGEQHVEGDAVAGREREGKSQRALESEDGPGKQERHRSQSCGRPTDVGDCDSATLGHADKNLLKDDGSRIDGELSGHTAGAEADVGAGVGEAADVAAQGKRGLALVSGGGREGQGEGDGVDGCAGDVDADAGGAGRRAGGTVSDVGGAQPIKRRQRCGQRLHAHTKADVGRGQGRLRQREHAVDVAVVAHEQGEGSALTDGHVAEVDIQHIRRQQRSVGAHRQGRDALELCMQDHRRQLSVTRVHDIELGHVGDAVVGGVHQQHAQFGTGLEHLIQRPCGLNGEGAVVAVADGNLHHGQCGCSGVFQGNGALDG